MKRKITFALFLLYCGIMLWMLFDRTRSDPTQTYWAQLRHHLNLIPFRTNWTYVQILTTSHNAAQLRHAVICLFGNVLTFIPFGYFLPRLWNTSLRNTLTIGTVTVISIELIQLFTLTGSCDIDDLLLNLPGIAIGWWLHSRMKK